MKDLVKRDLDAAAAIWHHLPDKRGEFVLGPSHGKLAYARIAIGKGTYDTAAAQKKTVLVADVYKSPGHIACVSNSASNLGIVAALNCGGPLIGAGCELVAAAHVTVQDG